MDTITITKNKKQDNPNASKEDIKNFYDEATKDYNFWSQDLNMHFGYYIPFKNNPFKRDTMLNEMNNQIYTRLQLKKGRNHVVDLGCGMGGTMRYFLNKNQDLTMFGVTLSPFQTREGNNLLKQHKAVIVQEDYCNTSIKSNSADGCVAIESLCHCGHNVKSFKEAYRILKPGGNFVVGDAFLKKSPDAICRGSNYCYNNLCKGWSLDGLGNIHDIEKTLKAIGFKNVVVEDISFRAAISVLHVPFAIGGFVLKSLLLGKSIKKQSKNNLKGSLFALLSGLHLKDFGYFLITATK